MLNLWIKEVQVFQYLNICLNWDCVLQGQSSRNRSDDIVHDRRCEHYYACVAAFACDEKLSIEFASFVVDQERSQEIVLNLQEQISGIYVFFILLVGLQMQLSLSIFISPPPLPPCSLTHK